MLEAKSRWDPKYRCHYKFSSSIQEVKSVKDEPASSTKSSVLINGAFPQASLKSGAMQQNGPVTEDEIRAMLIKKTPVTTQDLVAKFRSRLKSKEERRGLLRIS
ncbi:hypothetical protein OROGR_001205 [Orobanche gracilis]